MPPELPIVPSPFQPEPRGPSSRPPGALSTDALFVQVYEELRQLASRLLASEKVGHTLQPTALVHEAYVRLSRRADWSDRREFCAVAATAIRNILIDHARARRTQKRDPGTGGGDATLVEVPGLPLADAVDLGIALDELAARSPRRARVVELRFFGGLTVEETAEALGISSRTVESEWRFARAWLHRVLSGPRPSGADGEGIR